MQSMAQLLTATPKMTHTKNSWSRDSAQRHGQEIGIMQAIATAPKVDQTQSLPLCNNCGNPTRKDVVLLGKMYRMPLACLCRIEAQRLEEERFKAMDLQRRLDRFRIYSLMDSRFSNCTFENWTHRSDNKRLYEICKCYCDNWEQVYSGSSGLLLYGKPGCGKTYASFAIANELYHKGVAVMAISVSRILTIIRDSFDKHGNISEMEILNTISDASLLILDDLGTEHQTSWTSKMLFQIIDAREKASKPTIITTNLDKVALRKYLSVVDSKTGQIDSEDRIFDRIISMCTFEKVTGESWRIEKGNQNKANLFNKILRFE